MALNNLANQMFGIEARWFRAVPQQRSKDVIFQEYTLSCVEDTPKCIKVLLPDGNFPDSKYTYDLMGLEYEIPLTIHIDKKYWEHEVGFGTAPQKKDIVYLPLPNKLYQVESSHLNRGFLEQETTWYVNLIKYMPEASRRESEELKETIDNYTVSETELFGDAIESDIEKITNDKQFSPQNSTEIDKYKTLDEDLKIISDNINLGGLIVAESYYDMNTSDLFNAVRYKLSDSIDPNCDRALTIWVNPRETESREYSVTWIQKDTTLPYPANYKIKIKTSSRFQIGNTFVISRPGALNFYATVIDDSNAVDGIYFCQIEESVENYLNSINSNWPNVRNYKMVLKDPITLLDGINETNQGLKVELIANQYIKTTYGIQTYIASMNEQLDDNQWYGIVVNIGNTWNQYNVTVWEPFNGEEKIRIKFYETMKFEAQYTEIQEYTVDKSEAYITNIRLFTTTIEEEKQNKELLSYFSPDSDQALILDNADPRFRAPYISQQR